MRLKWIDRYLKVLRMKLKKEKTIERLIELKKNGERGRERGEMKERSWRRP